MTDNSSQKPHFDLESLGYTAFFADYRQANNLDTFDIGRVISEHKERYIVRGENGDYEAEIIGNLRYTANSRLDFPSVGDWVAISLFEENKAIIHAVYARTSLLTRKAVQGNGELQIIASNVNKALIVQAMDRDFSISRLERYLSICYDAQVEPLIVLNKTDLIDKELLEKRILQIRERIATVPIIPVSLKNQEGTTSLEAYIVAAQSYCLMGSSGVGKSSLINFLEGKELTKTGEIGTGNERGRHVTSSRSLFILNNGGIIIDTPGMRELGMSSNAKGIDTVFEQIISREKDCQFADCSHQGEKGCAIIQAVDAGEISKEAYTNFLKLQREKEHFESTEAEKRKKGKDLSKIIRKTIRSKRNNRDW